MSQKKQKLITKKVREKRLDIERRLIAEMCLAPLKYRWKWAMKVLKGSKKPLEKKTRRERKRVDKRAPKREPKSGQESLPTVKKESKSITK